MIINTTQGSTFQIKITEQILALLISSYHEILMMPISWPTPRHAPLSSRTWSNQDQDHPRLRFDKVWRLRKEQCGGIIQKTHVAAMQQSWHPANCIRLADLAFSIGRPKRVGRLTPFNTQKDELGEINGNVAALSEVWSMGPNAPPS